MVQLSRRMLLKGMVVTAAGLLIPADVLAEPEPRIWALDATQVRSWEEQTRHLEILGPVARGDLDANIILRYDRINPRTSREIIRVDKLHPDGRVEFVRWEGPGFWPGNDHFWPVNP